MARQLINYMLNNILIKYQNHFLYQINTLRDKNIINNK